MNKNESCVETPAAPEWLSKLESRREKLTRGRLGHEVGAGAPCNECGDKCPGLDLHFWRKVCRNCKCRKDQHMCSEDDLSGWAQFEILGQIRSKPAYIKIKAFADQPVKVDWVPPNATADIVSDYMNNLESTQIPVAGSDAATKRKQQLEFQVPPHDLDATLCDNLSESEAVQLQQYVNKIRENCVGQGNVIRIGALQHGNINNPPIRKDVNNEIEKVDGILTNVGAIAFERINDQQIRPTDVVKDKLILNLLNNDAIQRIIMSDQQYSVPLPKKFFVAFSQPTDKILNESFSTLMKNMKGVKLRPEIFKMNKSVIENLVKNGSLYDKILSILDKRNLDCSKDPILPAIKEFRERYKNDQHFKDVIDDLIGSSIYSGADQYSSPMKSSPADTFNSPIPLKYPIQTKTGMLMKQDTPIRRVRFGAVNVAHDLGIPIESTIEKDDILSTILNSEQLKHFLQPLSNRPLQLFRKGDKEETLVILEEPAIPTDFKNSDAQLHPTLKDHLESLRVNKNILKSVALNGPIYDKLLNGLKSRGINYSHCNLLAPIEELRTELLTNLLPFEGEILKYVEEHVPGNSFEGIINPNTIEHQHQQQMGKLSGSRSTDSGFDSKPPTPNYCTYPGGNALPNSQQTSSTLLDENNENSKSDDPAMLQLNAQSGKFTSIPGIEDLNMYPEVEVPNKNIAQQKKDNPLSKDLEKNLNISSPPSKDSHVSMPVLKCKECKENITTGEVAVKADRAGKEIAWHPQCFVCHKCRELLADLVYFYHGGNVYCGRDLAIILKIPRCNACDELIFTKEYTAAEGSTFHIKHFCCYHCDTPLAGQQYVPDEKTNMPVCLTCYDQYYAERCNFCKDIIGPTEQGVSWGKIHWHGNCFNCAGRDCGKSLLGGRFCIKNGMPFCSPKCVSSILN